jgi:D-sedoheptulose 7-phosphate isomerase
MSEDPRFRNELFDDNSMSTFVDGYVSLLTQSLRGVDPISLRDAANCIQEVGERGAQIYAIGNGGSAAIADHLCCDWTKGTNVNHQDAIKCISFVCNTSLYSAIANDYGFEKVFSTQLRYFGKRGDLLVAISSSGNSANVVNAVEYAKDAGITTIGLSGFLGGRLKELVDISLHVSANNYGIVEDSHQAIMHILAQYIAKKRDARE